MKIEAICEMEQVIQYGGLAWLKQKNITDIVYKTVIPDAGEARVYQYPMNNESWCEGQWHWSIRFNFLIADQLKPDVLKTKASNIRPTQQEAMLACLDAKGLFVEDMRRLLAYLCPGDEYAQGRRAGQEEVRQRIIDSLK